MFSITDMPSTTTMLSAYTSIAASTMIVRTIANEVQNLANQFIPQQFRGKIFEVLGRLYGNVASQLTLVVDEYDGLILNQMFEAAELYLRTKITPSIKKLRVSKIPKEKNLLVTVVKGQEIVDVFEGIQLTWKFSCTVTQSSCPGYEGGAYTNTTEKKNFELSFHSKDKKRVLDSYLPYVLERSKAIKEENRRVKLYSLGFYGDGDGGGVWGSINLDHPATFDTVAMDPKLKNTLLKDLDMFVRRREFYKRVGKAWKRGYLLYGPPGTGKSSLIAAMANYLNFNIYDLELANLHRNSELRRLLVSTANRSILVIEDIDCTVELQDRSHLGGAQKGEGDLTLSGLLNFIDGLWSSCGDERIIVFTTNHKDRLDPALLRPGRMDMHIHMTYCTPCGFKLLASNYLMIQNHSLFEEIEGLIKEVNITPAEVAEELMKSDDADISLKSLISLLQKKKTECAESNVEDGKEVDQGSKRQKIENEHENKIKMKMRTRRAKC